MLCVHADSARNLARVIIRAHDLGTFSFSVAGSRGHVESRGGSIESELIRGDDGRITHGGTLG